jgi:hypothetical protein
MNKLVISILLLCVSTFGFGQSITSSDPKTFVPSTNGQDASGFVLNGFTTTSTLLTSISLINAPTGTTFYLGRMDGLTPASGFTLNGNKTRLVVTGTMDNINIALSNLKVNTGSVIGNVQLSVAATVNPTGYFYNGVNGHFYRPISNGNTYSGARAAALNTTFKGQTGYLVTITSADEDAFIYNNVPQSQIWFALTDEVTEGRWVIDAGPEKGTVIKTANGQYSGNIVGQYNNWAGGEPNNAGNEDYAVTKWNGTQWNDLPNHFYCPYVIEYGTWTNPDDATFTEFYTNSVLHSNGEVLNAQFNFDFGSNIDESKFSTKLKSSNDGVTYSYTPTSTSIKLSQLGRVNATANIDGQKITNGEYSMLTTSGQVEWCVIYEYDITNKRYRVGVDSREFGVGSPQPNTITHLKLFDLWNGAVEFKSNDGSWTEYWIYTETQFSWNTSLFQSSIRNGGGYYALRAEFSFTPYEKYKPHSIEIQPLSTSDVQSLYDEIVTVSDVFIAFKELSNGGIFGNEIGNEFTDGVQFINADVNKDGVFNDSDTYDMLQHLTGVKSIQSTNELNSIIRLIDNSEYDGITKLNWNSKLYPISVDYKFDLNKALSNTYNINVSWLGDINLSHSAIPATSTNVSLRSLSTMSLKSNTKGVSGYIINELSNDIVRVDVKLSMNSNQTKGIQFRINYDNANLKFDKIEFGPTTSINNFNVVRENYVNVGSIITGGTDVMPETMNYSLYFKSNSLLKNSLGLISISNTEVVLSNSNVIKIEIK